ncbi:NAD(P)-binding protein [Hysterangium stoloniferum]|nr:NAD(P)-binding protein [Hysterangium stoloniferum]
MTTVPDSDFFVDADRVKGKVVLITGIEIWIIIMFNTDSRAGAANGLGRSAAIYFGLNGAKVVIGDLDIKGAEGVVQEIKTAGGDAVAQQCNVTIWEEQLSLFQFAIKTYGHIDIVVPNAGISERGAFTAAATTAVNGAPSKPNLKTLEVNLIGVLYSTRLALYYLMTDYAPGSNALKSLVFIGSMSSLESIPMAALYSVSKHAVVALMGSIYGEYSDRIRVGVVCPWFADTAILPTHVKLFLAGLPLTPIQRVGGTIFRVATDPNPETNGAIYTLPDDGEAYRIDRPDLSLNKGIYKLLNDRTAAALSAASTARIYVAAIKDIVRICGPKLIRLGLPVAVAVGTIILYTGREKAIPLFFRLSE